MITRTRSCGSAIIHANTCTAFLLEMAQKGFLWLIEQVSLVTITSKNSVTLCFPLVYPAMVSHCASDFKCGIFQIVNLQSHFIYFNYFKTLVS